MTVETLFAAAGFAMFGLAMLWFGVWLGLRFMRENIRQATHIARFIRDEDISDVADMGTDSEY